jgi:hypothetical protein
MPCLLRPLNLNDLVDEILGTQGQSTFRPYICLFCTCRLLLLQFRASPEQSFPH